MRTSMRTTKCLTVTVGAALLAGGVIVCKSQAVERLPGQRPFHGQLLEWAKEKLGLSDEQVAKIKTELRSEKDTSGQPDLGAAHSARQFARSDSSSRRKRNLCAGRLRKFREQHAQIFQPK